MSALLRIVLAFCMVGVGCANADNKRIALVIANSQYKHTAVLKNPPNDSKLIARKLHDLGFDVQVESDLDAKGFSRVIQVFVSKLDKNTDALFYYAGHGWQDGAENYLVAVDATLASEATIQFETFRLNTVRNLIEGKASTALIFWDGCRNNPLAGRLQIAFAPMVEPSSAVRASAPIPPSRGDTLVVFSAEPGRFALDGSGEFSPFAESLAKHIATPNLEVESMLKRVKADVLAKTKDQQPEVLSRLAKEFYFNQQGDEQLAYKQELDALRAKIDQLEHPKPDKQFEIVPSPQMEPNVKPAGLGTANGTSVAKYELPSPQAPTGLAPTAAPQPLAISNAIGVPKKESASPGQAPTATPSIPDAITMAKQESPSPQTSPATDTPSPVSASKATNHPPPAVEVNVSKPELVVSVNSSLSTIVRKLRISPDGKLLAIGADDGIIRIVSLDTFEVIRTINAHEGRVSDLDFSPNSLTLLSAGRDGFLRFWDAKLGKKTREDLRVAGSVPYAARFNSESPEYILMGDKDGRLFAWNLARNDRLVAGRKFHNGPVQSVAYQPQGKGTYFSAGGDGLLNVRLPEGQRFVVHAHAGPIFAAGYNQSGNLIYSAGSDRKLKVWDPNMLKNGGEPLAVLQGHLKYLLTATISQDGKTMASGGGDQAIDLWEVGSRKLIGRLRGHTSDIEALAFTPNNQFVISASEDRSVRIWSVDGQKELVRLFFRTNSGKYAGTTYDNKSFGDREAGILTLFIDGKVVAETNEAYGLNYIGHGISIVDVKKPSR